MCIDVEALLNANAVLTAAAKVLEDGESKGCDGLIVISMKSYRVLQKAVEDATGITYGACVNIADED